MSRKCQDHLGNEYSSENKMAAAYGLTSAQYRTRKAKGWDVEKILTTPSRTEQLKVKDHTGREFGSKSEMCDFYQIPHDTFELRI